MNWIVTWVVLNTFMIGCPPTTPAPNDYGIGNGDLTMTYSIACWDTETTEHKKSFSSKKEATDFIMKGEKDFGCDGIVSGPGECIKEFKLYQEVK